MAGKKLYINHELVGEKIADMEKALAILDQISRIPEKDFLEDQILISGAKYQLIVAIEAAQNLCNHLAARVAREAPESYADCFRILGRKRIISKELALKLASMARFRNLLVHQYGKVDDSTVYQILKNDTGDISKYTEEIRGFLKSVQEEEQKNVKRKAPSDGRSKEEN
ncbi:MAG: DUF86 domain-containing protein [Thermoanaerobacteraceae bacterium]|nr:DUF86 domain-containing protein [Thermoanaerobacteraceae bacterium]